MYQKRDTAIIYGNKVSTVRIYDNMYGTETYGGEYEYSIEYKGGNSTPWTHHSYGERIPLNSATMNSISFRATLYQTDTLVYWKLQQ